MPPKFNPNDPETAKLISLFQSIGFNQAKAAETAKSAKNAAALKDLIETNDLANKVNDDKKANLLSTLAGQGTKLDEPGRAYIMQAILDGRLKSADQTSAAVKYVEGAGGSIDHAEFDKACGVGFSITPEGLYAKITDFISDNSATASGWNNLSSVINAIKTTTDLRWASPLEVKSAVERAFTDTFGPKPTGKVAASEPKAKKERAKEAVESTSSPQANIKTVFEEGFLGALHKPGENPQIQPRLKEEHLAATKGAVWTRFPPEPNGFLHIGHSKAIFVDFGYAAHHGGKTYLRYDDTNPEKEEAQYFESILETVRWLGYEPWKITYSSDYFDRLYELAVELIERDKGYVCLCSGEEMRVLRGERKGGPKPCQHRDRPVAESLADFEKMKTGAYRPGEAVLRMKQDLNDGNPQMWDLVAYRVLDAPHHRTHDKWKIYPTYDFTHCLVDSFENISHSLCTTEFVLSRVSYEWLCDALEVYKPRQYEFGRLSVEGAITSKRKLLKLVQNGYVSGWDDPRLYTLIALRRRGVPPGAIISFVSSLGVSTAMSVIQVSRFEQTLRQYLENTVPRLLMVLKPLKVVIENLPEDYVQMLTKPLHPKMPELGSSTIPFTRTIYIDADDFRLQDSKDYFRLAPGKTVGLFQAPHPITCISYKTDDSGAVVELRCKFEDGSDGVPVKKPKAFIQWVAEHAPSHSPVRVDEVRIFYSLFKSENPAALPDFTQYINPDSLETIKGAMVEVGFWSLAKQALEDARKESEKRTAKVKAAGDPAAGQVDTPHVSTAQLVGNECVRFQGLRVAYFALDSDGQLGCLANEGAKPGPTEGDRIVLNRIVSLKEDAGKAA